MDIVLHERTVSSDSTGSPYTTLTLSLCDAAKMHRHRIVAAAELETPYGARIDVYVTNASLTGAFVKMDDAVALLSSVRIRPLTPSSEWIDAWVVRVNESGVGLEWFDPDVRHLSALLASVRPSAARSRTSLVPYRPSPTEAQVTIEQ